MTQRAADIRVAWLVYVRTYCVPIATLNQNKRTRLFCLGDAQNNIPNPINSKYHYLHDIENITLSSDKSFFSLSYVNLNSLDAHLDDLRTTAHLLDFPFQVTGVTETRENVSTGFKINNALHVYNLYTQLSTGCPKSSFL